MDYFSQYGYKLEEDYYKDNPDELGTPTDTFKDAFDSNLDDYYEKLEATKYKQKKTA